MYSSVRCFFSERMVTLGLFDDMKKKSAERKERMEQERERQRIEKKKKPANKKSSPKMDLTEKGYRTEKGVGR